MLEQNLRAITEPELRNQAAISPTGSMVAYTESRDGLPIPVIRSERGTVHLHSRYGPLREAMRVAKAAPEVGYVVILGLGGAYHVEAIVRQFPRLRVLVLEPESDTLRHLLRRRDVSQLLRNPLVRVCLVDPSAPAETLIKTIQDDHVPSLDGPPAKMTWPGENAQPTRLRAAAEAALEFVAEASRDELYTHADLADIWVRNIARNAVCGTSGGRASPGGAHRGLDLRALFGSAAVIAAAGPSLETWLAETDGTGKQLIATDTALPALLAAGRNPALVVSVDPKPLGAYHLKRGGEDLPLAASVTAAPTLINHLHSSLLHDGHPLVTAAERLASLPSSQLPVSLGPSVTHGAIAVARLAGAHHIQLVGADFSYPQGKPYARGSYVYDWFLARAHRTLPVEAQATEMVFLRGTPLQSEPLIYQSELLEKYRASAEALIAGNITALEETPTVNRRSLRDGLQKVLASLTNAAEPADPVRAFLHSAPEATANAYLACIPHLAVRAKNNTALRAGAEELSWARNHLTALLSRYVRLP